MTDFAADAAGDDWTGACEAAVLRVFTEMRRLGECEETALGAALRVFVFHEPSMPPHLASAIVEKWTRQDDGQLG